MTKKKLLILALTLMLMALFPLPVIGSTDDSDAQLSYITDAYDLISSSEAETLYASAASVSSKQSCSVYVIIVDDYTDYVDSDITGCAQALYNYYDLGWGEDRDGILLLLSMDERDYGLIAHGSVANAAFTDYGKYVLADEFLDDFADDRWFEGLKDYIEECDDFLDLYYSGSPVDTKSDEYDGRYDDAYEAYFGSGENVLDSNLYKVVGTIAVSLIIALVVCLILRKRMKSVHPATDADYYAERKNLQITESWDRFSHVTEVVIPKPDSKNNSLGGGGLGGGGTTISGGFSGHGGKF